MITSIRLEINLIYHTLVFSTYVAFAILQRGRIVENSSQKLFIKSDVLIKSILIKKSTTEKTL